MSNVCKLHGSSPRVISLSCKSDGTELTALRDSCTHQLGGNGVEASLNFALSIKVEHRDAEVGTNGPFWKAEGFESANILMPSVCRD